MIDNNLNFKYIPNALLKVIKFLNLWKTVSIFLVKYPEFAQFHFYSKQFVNHEKLRVLFILKYELVSMILFSFKKIAPPN